MRLQPRSLRSRSCSFDDDLPTRRLLLATQFVPGRVTRCRRRAPIPNSCFELQGTGCPFYTVIGGRNDEILNPATFTVSDDTFVALHAVNDVKERTFLAQKIRPAVNVLLASRRSDPDRGTPGQRAKEALKPLSLSRVTRTAANGPMSLAVSDGTQVSGGIR